MRRKEGTMQKKKKEEKKNEAINGKSERKEETINYFSDMSLSVSLYTERKECEKGRNKGGKKDYKDKKIG